MKFSGLLGGMGNSGIRAISQSDAVLDISGGDRFTDLYGLRRFDTVTLPKLITLQQKKPLVLLPQTYGPFADRACEKKASEIVKQSSCAWARDKRSFEVLKNLLGSSFDPQIHQCGVDVAFGLPAVKPSESGRDLIDFFAGETDKIGINVSGLIYNEWEKSQKRFGFKADYRRAVLALLQRFLTETDCTIVLVPHVIAPKGHFESDVDACKDLVGRLDSKQRDRVIIIPAYNNPCEVKWVISRLDWFCGTRMHATIAALSSGVPVSAISYSPKTLGVFETCGQGNHVADPQVMTESELVDCLWSSWENRDDALLQFDRELPGVKLLVNEQMKSILDIVRG
jgi:polysaccharide pyruvyl transferase WcaK-like protein